MPDPILNGGYSPYLAQALTPMAPQGIGGSPFGGAWGASPANVFGGPLFGSTVGPGIGGMFGVTPFGTMPQLSPFAHLYGGWQHPIGWPYGQVQPAHYWQAGDGLARIAPFAGIGQTYAHPHFGATEPLLLAHLLRQYAVPISIVMASPYGQAQIAHNIVQTAEMLSRVLPLVGAPQLTPLVQLLGQYAVPISAAVASPYGQAQIVQNIVHTAEMLARVLPLVLAQQPIHPLAQLFTGWQQPWLPQTPLTPQLPVAHLLGQLAGPGMWQQPWSLAQQGAFPQFGGGIAQPFGQAPFGQSGDLLTRIMPYLAQQGLVGQGYAARA